jgi:hypothetical protein
MKQKLVVITKDGKVVTPHLVNDSPVGGAVARLVARQGQQAHEVEIEAPARFSTPKVIDEFHRTIEEELSRRAATGRGY